jgi:hypothetical protein
MDWPPKFKCKKCGKTPPSIKKGIWEETPAQCPEPGCGGDIGLDAPTIDVGDISSMDESFLIDPDPNSRIQ